MLLSLILQLICVGSQQNAHSVESIIHKFIRKIKDLLFKKNSNCAHYQFMRFWKLKSALMHTHILRRMNAGHRKRWNGRRKKEMMGMQFVLKVSIIFNCYQFGADKKNDERAIDLRQYLQRNTFPYLWKDKKWYPIINDFL